VKFAPAILLLSACCWHDHGDHPSYGPHGPACADIRAATRLDAPGEALRTIAARVTLDAHEQVYLIEAAVDAEAWEALHILVKNARLHPDARHHLSWRLEDVPEPERKKLVDEMIRK
jgi:hypothetical protein